MAEPQNFPHALTLDQRKRLTMTGVTEVVSFDEVSVVLKTGLGTLLVTGDQLQLKQLVPEGGSVAVEGRITGLTYEEPRSGGWLSRLLG